MPQRRPVEKIHAAAFYYACISQNLQDVADAFSVSTAAVRKWMQTPEWENALKVFGYEGNDVKLTRDTAREKPEELENARSIYLELLANGEPVHRLPRLVSEATGIKQRTIYEWAKRYNWQGEAPNE